MADSVIRPTSVAGTVIRPTSVAGTVTGPTPMIVDGCEAGHPTRQETGTMIVKTRKNIRLPRPVYEYPNHIFFITICTANRRQLFSGSLVARKVVNTLKSGPIAKQTDIFAYSLMPDHLHILIAAKNGNLIHIIGGWKRFTGSLLRRNGLKGPFWQRGFYDHALRKDEDLAKAAEYMVMNPVRAGLVEQWQEYPFSWHRWM